MLLILDLDGTVADLKYRSYLIDKPDPTQEESTTLSQERAC